ncbi:MAG TPA: methyltransferase domain-containing protein [Kiritimatiellia bacterium]|nr:methyltransferase domain-containing protein [Kiritimatiellia bacterium]HRZ12068.1 methyltransferase domain-containing protein [Kiritimatiellia bacterium]HSA19601.1 methyltransferase domain-containing protein [Kiritimatiellia bacterium]
MADAEKKEVQAYFDRVAGDFDSIYSGRKSGFARWLDRVFRRDMYDRMRLTLEECSAPELKSILDIGTGSGRFCLPLAPGKERVVGLDFSPAMIELARKHAREQGVADKCRFEVGDFLQARFDEPFDAIMAIGLFDYIREPLVFLKRMKDSVRKKVVATWPTVWTWRAPVRWLRLKLQGCPVYFFTPAQIRKHYADAGFAVTRLERVGKIYFVVAAPAVP